MEKVYKTVEGTGSFEVTDRKSRFLGLCCRAHTEAEALAVIEQCRSEYRTADHHVFAYRLRHDNLTRYSDDREPQSTAGLPVLNVLTSGGITDCVIVVTRYFGGTLLGTGGLVRAYSAAASGALERAGIVTMQLCSRFRVTINYADHDRLCRYLSEQGNLIEQVSYTEMVTLTILVARQNAEQLEADIKQHTRGSGSAVFLEQQYAVTDLNCADTQE